MSKCQSCGKEGAIVRLKYIGGQGYVELLICKDRINCALRWNEQNGFTWSPKTGLMSRTK